ncbi:integrase repeat-containing protein [Photobacterium leiognathi]|uniref:integrase repeat-containing protein n=1 Tax=Photobacterium leiognathi TaxID=553611 RepID=UPI0029821FF2|nr:integrase repeat-containing protein [Photobacterium leiognathi]
MGKPKKNFYPTIFLASLAANKLGIRTLSDYNLLAKNDPLLPSSPYTVYQDWKGFRHFISLARNADSRYCTGGYNLN